MTLLDEIKDLRKGLKYTSLEIKALMILHMIELFFLVWIVVNITYVWK